MKRSEAMKLPFLYIFLTGALTLGSLVPTTAQTNQKTTKKATTPAKKKPTKKVTKPAVAMQKTTAKSLGDAIANAKADTSKKGGQSGVNNGNLSEEIVVTTAYKPVLADAVKIRINPDLDDKAPFKAPLNYTPIDNRLEQNTDIKQLEAMKRPAETDSDLFNNYVKVGLGNLKTTYGEAYFNNGQDQGLQVGGYLKHFAQEGSLLKQNTAKEEASIFGKGVSEQNSISGRIDYSYNSNYFYGGNSILFPLMDNQQHFSVIRGEGDFAKNYKDVPNDFTYALKLSGYLFNDAFQAKESNIVVSGFLNKVINQFYAGVSASLDLTTQQDSMYSHNNNLVRINPYLKFQGDNYKIEAGVNLVDEFGFASSFKIFPAAKLEYQLVPKYLRVFAEATGNVNKSTLLDFTTINPFLGGNIPINNSVDQLDISAGLKGTIFPGFGFKVVGFRNWVQDMPLFVSNFDFANGYNRFTVIYVYGTSTVNGINAELDYKATEQIDLFARAEFKQYNIADNQQPWNLPTKKITGGAIISIGKLVTVTGTAVLRGSAMDPDGMAGLGATPATLKSFADLSGGIQYKASKRFSIFVNANNILNTSNQRWLYYQNYGFNIFGGVSARF
jgi:hypothetical protein